MSDEDKEDKGYIILGPELENGGHAALRVTKDGVHAGEMYKPGTGPQDCEDGTLTRLTTRPLGGSVLEVMEEEPIGKPSMVNSRAYRENWDNIFGNKKVVGNA